MGYSIFKINFDTGENIVLYDCIDNLQEADLLAQLAMCDKDSIFDLIFISAGWNMGIDKNPELYNKALLLAEEYKSRR